METTEEYLARGGKIKNVEDCASKETRQGKKNRKNRTEKGVKGRFYNIEQILDLVPVSKSTIYAMQKAGEFPRQRKIGERVAVWVKTEIDAWIDERIAS